jgi:hypothetical protein
LISKNNDMKKVLLFNLLLISSLSFAQDSTSTLIQDAIFDRPFIDNTTSKTALGGYLEANSNYFIEDGLGEGLSFEMRRFNIFLYSSISERIKFLAELEFEHGTEEIALETALLDFRVNESLNLRAGILLPQIGIVNANHDSPKWDIIDRPLSSLLIIPTTLSEVGFGVFGKFYLGNNTLSYDAYIVNGLQDGIVLNEEGITSISSGKSEEAFGEDNNGTPMYNGRVSISNREFGEFGLSYYGGVYNSYLMEGEEVDEKRSLHLIALDFSTNIKKLSIKGEYVKALIDVAEDIDESYGTEQNGGFIQATYPIIEKTMFGYTKAKINAVVRAEAVDLNQGTFKSNFTHTSTIEGNEIGNDIKAFVLGVSFRPTSSTTFRANYRKHWSTDILNNPPAMMAGFQFGFASFF